MEKLIRLENLTFLALILGALFGFFFPEVSTSLHFLGELFLSLLKMVVIPLIFTSVFMSMLQMGGMGEFRDLGFKTFFLYLITTSLSVITGLVLVSLLEPRAPLEGKALTGSLKVSSFTLKDFLNSVVPENPIRALSEGRPLQVITFALLLGLAFLRVGKEKREHAKNFMDGINDALLVLTKAIILLTPLGVFFIVANTTAQSGISSLLSLYKYALTVVLGLLIHGFITLPLLGFTLGRFNPYRYFFKVREAPLLALSTASSSATLPVTMEVCQEKGGVRKEVARFVLPLGATVNMDGTALYEAVAVVFIANSYGLKLQLLQLILIFLTATLASIGAAGIPSAGLVTMSLVLKAVGLPLESIGLILGIDRFLDMLRTSVNVWGDLTVAKIVNRWKKD